MNWKTMRIASLLALLAPILACLAIAPVQAQSALNYCFNSTCYATLDEAEGAMRASSVFAETAVRSGTALWSLGSAGISVRLVYEAPSQPPKRIFNPVYTIGGWDSSSGICGSSGDPVRPNMCADDAAAASAFLAYTRSVHEPSGCRFYDEHFEGEYQPPFSESQPATGAIGELYFSVTRFYVWMAVCSGWPDPTPGRQDAWVGKYQAYECAPGYAPARGLANQPEGSGSPDLTWDSLCLPPAQQFYITVQKVSQTPSCAINANPCFPATGDKARFEPDFTFAGVPYVRAYHSLRQLQSNSTLGVGWSDSFSDYLLSSGVRVTETGYLESGIRADDYHVRGQKNHGDMISQGSSSAPWVLTKGNGELRVFNRQSFKLQSITTADGANTLTVLRVGDRISRVVDQKGRALVFSYDKGLLTGIGLPGGGSVLYDYDVDRNLVKVTREDGTVRRYLYDEPGKAPDNLKHLLTGIEDGGVRYATFTYDSQGRATSSTLKSDGQDVEDVHITYDAAGNASVVDSLGAVRQFVTGGAIYRDITASSVDGITTATHYDNDGRLDRQVDGRGGVTTTAYDDSFNAGGNGVSQVVTTSDASGRATVVRRNLANRVFERRISGANGAVSQLDRFVYDAGGRLTFSCRYEDAGSSYVCGSSDPAPAGVRQVRRFYCASAGVGCPLEGLLTAVDGARTDVADITRYAYREGGGCDGGACAWRAGDLWKITDSLGRAIEVLAYDGAGRPLRIVAPDGRVTSYEYDARGRVARILQGDGNDPGRVTAFEYRSSGQIGAVTDGDGVTTTFNYDSAQRLRRITDGLGNAVEYTLDAAGNVVLEEVKDTSGALKRTTSRIYNQLGQLKTVADAASNPTDYTYDANGNRVSTIDALGRTTTQEYDPLNRLTKVVQDLGGIAATTTMQYDVLDNITQVIDPKGLATTYTYNGFGELQTQTSPDTGTTQFTYDAAGNVASRTDARGVTATYGYDALNRLTAVHYPTSSNDIGYVYDTVSPVCQASETFAIGRLSWMTDASGRTDYCYNAFGEVVRKVQQADGISLALRYSYTPGGRLASLTYPDGSTVDYVRDSLGRISEIGVTPPSGIREVLLTDVTYLPFGPSTGWRYDNGRTVVRHFDQDYRPIGIADSKQDLKLGFGYDPVGDLVDLASGDTQIKLQYDALGRLTHFKDAPSGATIDQYTYDATGNRTSFSNAAGTVPYGYPADSHRLTSVGGELRTYDATGNTTSIGGTDREFVYDERGRMAQVKRSGAVAQDYLYNAKGEQVARLGGAGAGLLLYDEAGHSLGDYDAAGLSGQQVIWMDDAPVGLLEEGGLSYVEPDHLGSPRVVVDPVKDALEWSWSLGGEAFGNTSPDEDPDSDGESFVLDLRFPGQRYDLGASASYNYFRTLDSATGRYLESDAIGLSGGPATYSYVSGAPFAQADFLGLAPWVQMAGCAIGGGIGSTLGGAAGASSGVICFPSGPGALGCVAAGGAVGWGVGGLAGCGAGAWAAGQLQEAIARPRFMNSAQESVYDKVCKNADDKCSALQQAVDRMISDAEGKMMNMRRDPQRLFDLAKEVPNPGATGTATTWVGHIAPLQGQIGRIREAISLGEMMGCDMSAQKTRAAALYVPMRPGP